MELEVSEVEVARSSSQRPSRSHRHCGIALQVSCSCHVPASAARLSLSSTDNVRMASDDGRRGRSGPLSVWRIHMFAGGDGDEGAEAMGAAMDDPFLLLS